MENESVKIFHFHSDGKLAPGLHQSKADFAAALNRVGVCAALFPDVVIIAFDIEDTHLHFVLRCLLSRGLRMIEHYKKLTNMYLAETRPEGNMDIQIVFNYEPVEDVEYLKKVNAYTVIQSTKNGKQILPFDYPWGSAPLYFRSEKAIPVWLVDKGGAVKSPVTIGTLDDKTKRRWFHTREVLPSGWQVCNGLILPSNYVDINAFERAFGSHNSYRCFLAKANDEVRTMMAFSRGVGLPDMEMRKVCQEKCQAMFHKDNIRSLNVMERLELARSVRKKYLVSHAQLSRLVHVPVDELERYV